ncbi:MAG: hypothetical protein WBM14_14795 [Terracidiphilus sp.]|jgi:hypothetical protein
MVTAISGNVAAMATQEAAAAAQAAATPAPNPAASSAAAASRATAQDSVTLSPQGQQASHAALDVDHDGDSH